jgi:hypothetical protein
MLASCSGNVVFTPGRTLPEAVQTKAFSLTPPPATVTVTPALTVTPTRPITATPYLTPTPTATQTPTIPPEAMLKIQCLEVTQASPPLMTIEGTLVLHGYRGEPAFLLKLETGDKIILPETSDAIGVFDISPNGQWLAYMLFREKPERKIFITEADGQIRQTLPWEEAWSSLSGWLDNNRLLIDLEGDRVDSVLVLNPFTGQRKVLLPDYPDIYTIDAPYAWEEYASTLTAYDPTLTRVVYPGPVYEHPPAMRSYVIWDLPTHQEITKVLSIGVWDEPPMWSPDGSQFLIAMPQREFTLYGYIPDDELYSVSRDGQITKLTNLSAYYPGLMISNYSWSPDGRYIAFWMEPNPPPGGLDYNMQLAVLDTVTQEVTLFCIKGDFKRFAWTPIWSPNSQQVMILSRSDDNISKLVLVDVVNSLAVEVAQWVMPGGWMVSTP